MFQHGNGPTHNAQLIKAWIARANMEELKGLTLSRDLKLTEHFWDKLL